MFPYEINWCNWVNLKINTLIVLKLELHYISLSFKFA